MSSLSLSDKLRQRLHLKRYLEELEALAGRPVEVSELGSLQQAAALRAVAQKLNTQSAAHCEIRFSDKGSERFKRFLQNLADSNSSPIYVWTPRTIDCGTFLIPSLKEIRFDFEFAINDEGILAFTTSDLIDSLLLDFSITPMGEQVMKIETQGVNWSRVIY